jgi:protein O-mannosyl-transferase
LSFACAQAEPVSIHLLRAITAIFEKGDKATKAPTSPTTLSSLLLYVLGRKRVGAKRWSCYGGCFVSFIFAVGSKEPAIMIIATILLYEFYFFRDLRFSKNAEKNRKIGYMLLGGGAVVFALVLWQGNTVIKLIGLSYDRYDFDMYQRLLTQPRILVYYLSLVFWPRADRICVDPSFMEHSSSWLHP